MAKNTNNQNNATSCRITTTLLPEQYQLLSAIAENNKVSMAWLIRRAVQNFIEEVSDGQVCLFKTDQSSIDG